MDQTNINATSSTPNEGSNKFGFLKKILTLKLIYIFLGVIILAEVIWGARTLLTKPSVTSSPTTVAQVTVPSVILSAPQRSYQLGEVVPVTIGINTAESHTDGSDVVLKFDPNILESSPSSFIKGDVYPEYPLVSVDNDKGLVQISGITSSAQGFQGVGVFGKLNFRAKSRGQSSISVLFKPSSTTESNITESQTAKNILEKAYNVSINVGQ